MKFRSSSKFTNQTIDKAGTRHELNWVNDCRWLNVTLPLTQEQYNAVKGGRDIDVAIEPVQTREERLREARLEALERQVEETGVHPAPWLALNIIERVDAEFGKENPE